MVEQSYGFVFIVAVDDSHGGSIDVTQAVNFWCGPWGPGLKGGCAGVCHDLTQELGYQVKSVPDQ